MRVLFVAACLMIAPVALSRAATSPRPAPPPVPPEDDYRPGADSQRQPGVPVGKTFSFKFDRSQVFPGTTRTISVYVPAQYKADAPACAYVNLDGLGFSCQIVFDNLIHKKEMPVVIGIGISPGQVDSLRAPEDPRFNRSFEFDGLNDSLARLLLDEILPEVEKQKTPDGLPMRLSKDPNDRCVAGGSTGAIAAFTLAWERPDAFRRVFSAIGTFVGMRGGDRYPVLVRKTEPKPIRIFMQDGSNDQWMGGPEVGDWWMSNQTLQRALEFSGYQVEHVWGHGIHSGRHPNAVFPDAMRWLWKDWPQPIKAGESQNTFLKAILAPGEDWQTVPGEYRASDALASDAQGEVSFRDASSRKLYKLAGAKLREAAADGGGVPMAFGPDGRIYLVDSSTATITAGDSAGRSAPVAEGIRAAGLLVLHNGNIYATETTADQPGDLWLVKPGREKVLIDQGLNHPSGIAVSPDGLWLAVVESKTHWGYSYRIEADGKLHYKQRFYWFHVPDWADDSGAGSLCMDRDGRLYAATRLGIQVLDRNGRVRAILPLPGGQVGAVAFGGAGFGTLYATCGGRLYQRKVRAVGVPPCSAPVKLPPWGAG